MTTINNLTIEQMRGIVDGAPEGATHTNQDSYFKENDYGVWSIWVGYWNSAFRWPESEMFLINDLRTAIAKHDSPEFKVGDLVVYHSIESHKNLFSVRYVGGDSITVYECLDEMGAKTFSEDKPYSNIRHATPSEIKAGHRIDDTTDHVTTQLCIGCGSPDLHKGGEIKEPKMCLDCFAEMVGFTRTSNGFVESDEVTDIRNHVSPSTIVKDLEAERHG